MNRQEPPVSASFSGANSQLSLREFEQFRDFLQEVCGIFLAENKQYLVTTRIRKILQEHQLESLASLVDKMRQPRHSLLRDQVVDAMTTNETFWFRDGYPFDYLQSTLLPEFQGESAFGPIRIWSAACSSGQEPYSISMLVEESLKSSSKGRRKVEVVATDLSGSMLDQARLGVYDKMSIMRGLSPLRLDNYLTRQKHYETWEVRPEIKRRIKFQALNLLDSYTSLGKFDVIFCRNVLIYFNGELKNSILRKLYGALKPGGALILGASEGLGGADDQFEMVHCSPGVIYRAR